MILYFSGTGNSAYVANKIAKELQDETLNLLDKIKKQEYSTLHSDKPWVIVAPTYAWRIPHILHDWLSHTKLQGHKDIYFIMTCGGSVGNAGSYLKKLCDQKDMKLASCLPIVMPDNYIALFGTPTFEQSLTIIKQAESSIQEAIHLIKEGYHIEIQASFKDKIRSGIVNTAFYPAFVHAKKFYATDACIACGKCVQLCPFNNITLSSKKPSWGTNCTHCMACINQCPTEAIEYGKKTVGLRRYTCPK